MILPGTKIVCPDCDLHIATAMVPIIFDDEQLIYEDDFDWHVQQPKSTNCPECSGRWGDKGGWLHTELGWEEI